MANQRKKLTMANRFRGLLPVVIDVETAGLNPQTDALLEIAAVMVGMDTGGQLSLKQVADYYIEPFIGANIDARALEITGIDPQQPLRYAIPEQQALRRLFAEVRLQLEATHCQRAVLVGHNAWFDLSFMLAAAKRAGISNVPFHSFTTFDTASLAGVMLGETVLARATRRAGIAFDVAEAHSAVYDATKTAELFCQLVNRANFSL